MRLVLIRHGATAWSVTGEHTGRTDVSLSDAGRAQLVPLERVARDALGERWNEVTIYSSPLQRALVSARLVMGEGREITLDPRLVEFDYGQYEGLRPEEVRALRPGWDIWLDGCPGGENVDDVGRRLSAFLADAAATQETAIVFAHSHVIRIMAAISVGLDAREGRIFTLDTASLSVIEDVRGKRVIERWNVRPPQALT